jgi:hypothetical protein
MPQRWNKKSFRLKEKHGWKSKPGQAICVIDRGAIRFDYPAGWNVSVEDIQINVRDRPHPDDNCVLSVSRMHIPTELADQLPVSELAHGATSTDEEGELLETKMVAPGLRADGVELAYTETRYMERKEKKEAFLRLAVARGSGVYCLITFSFWAEDLAKFDPVWKEALRSLTLGLEVKDPMAGPARN